MTDDEIIEQLELIKRECLAGLPDPERGRLAIDGAISIIRMVDADGLADAGVITDEVFVSGENEITAPGMEEAPVSDVKPAPAVRTVTASVAPVPKISFGGPVLILSCVMVVLCIVAAMIVGMFR